MAEGDVNTKLSEWLVVILICFSLVVEFVLHRLEHWINRRHHHLQAVVKVLYRELMILGLVSFIFVIYNTVNSLDPDVFISFEFAHMFIFLLAVFYTMVVLSTMFTSLRLSYRWKRIEQLDLVKYLHQKEKYTNIRLRIHRHSGAPWRWFWWWFPNFRLLWTYTQLHEMMAFHDIRFQFIFYRNLPEHFRFSSFLRKIKSITFVDIVESHWSLSGTFLIIVLGDLLRRYTVGSRAENGELDVVESAFIIAAAILLMIIVQVLAMKIRRIFWELTKNPRIYYEGIEPAAVAEELAAAEARLEEQRAHRRRTRSVDGPREDLGEVADDEATDIHLPAPHVSPESEMLEPMHMTINMPSGVQDPESAAPIARTSLASAESAIVPNPSNINLRSESVKNRIISAALQGSRTAYTSPYMSDQKSPDDELKDIAVRHSLDYKTHVASGSRSAGHSLEYQNSKRSPSQDVNVSRELHETATRHSLDVTQQNFRGSFEQMSRNSREAFVVKAAVEAARRRTTEGQLGASRHTDSQSPSDGERQGEGQRPGDNQRPLVEAVRRIASPKILPRLSSRGVSTDNDGRASSADYGRGSVESRGRDRRSIELAAAMPMEELAMRHHFPDSPPAEQDIEAGIVRPENGDEGSTRRAGQSSAKRRAPQTGMKTGSRDGVVGSASNDELNTSTDGTSVNRIVRYKSLGFMNATIIRNLEHHEKAKSMQPASYPRIVKKIIPRLGRVASPVEKLFWFGSHRFFLWCVEFCLYFSTVLLAAASASLALLNLQKRSITKLNLASLLLSVVSLLFVLVRTAGIVKKYIFILHNASLVPESLTIEAIHRVNKKGLSRMREDESSDLSGSETEREEGQAAVERRRTLGRFFRSEAESGNMPGIDISNGDDVSIERPLLRARRRRYALRRRILRRRAGRDRISAMPNSASQGSAEVNANS